MIFDLFVFDIFLKPGHYVTSIHLPLCCSCEEELFWWEMGGEGGEGWGEGREAEECSDRWMTLLLLLHTIHQLLQFMASP